MNALEDEHRSNWAKQELAMLGIEGPDRTVD